ncbi:MAG: hypothetical protein JXB26_08695 [Candidatus Aminicenantes bacterium]|nr:hypothetical protein [Candidatus Aminicenantes bacterium]
MESSSILLICTLAFLMVFLLLAFLAVLMRLIIYLFPEKAKITDAAVFAAMAAVFRNIFPHSKISNIEEKK